MKNKQRKHRKFVQILIIPDDQAEPKTYSIPVQRLKLYKILGAVLVFHLLLGIVGYVMLGRYYKKNQQLLTENRQLQESNQQFYKLAKALKDLENSQSKIRAALGLGKLNMSNLISDQNTEFLNAVPDIAPVYESRTIEYNPPETNSVEKLGFLQRSKSGIHNYEKSIPTLLPAEGVLSTDYQQVKLDGRVEHKGIDIAAQRGSFVRASADGVVIFSGWANDLGNLVILYHGNGFLTYYGHNQRNLVQRGTFVKKGDPIALLGSSGHSSAPHLHFEIWKDGVPQDPKQYILAFSGL